MKSLVIRMNGLQRLRVHTNPDDSGAGNIRRCIDEFISDPFGEEQLTELVRLHHDKHFFTIQADEEMIAMLDRVARKIGTSRTDVLNTIFDVQELPEVQVYHE